MRLKKNLKVSSSDFWYDITDGGYIDPYEVCEFKDDARRVEDAIQTLREFQESCEEQIEGFLI